MDERILVIHGTDPRQMAYDLLAEADLAGLIGGKNQAIGIKPNLVLPSPADQGATTHPQIVQGAIQYLKDRGFRNLCVLEGSWVGASTQQACRVCGIDSVVKESGVPFYDMKREPDRTVNLGGMALQVCERALGLDFLVNLPVVKGHCQTTVTCALKNLKGLIPDGEKRRFHTLGLHKPIAHLALAFPRQYVLADNICGDLDFEEGGNPVPMDRLIGCADPVLLDAYACQAMGVDIGDVPYIGLAQQLGAGSAQLDGARVVALGQVQARQEARPTRRVQALARYIQDRDACSACYGALIHALARLDEQGELGGQRPKLSIGQGYKGQSGLVGVGNCAKGCQRALGGCPPRASDMVSFLRDQWKAQ